MKAALIDTETTGLTPNRSLRLERQPEIIEFYGCLADLDTGEIAQEVDVLIRPSRFPMVEQVPEKGKRRVAMDIHNISNEMVENAPPFREVAPAIFSLIGDAEAVIGHHLAFDVDVLEIEAERAGIAVTWPRKICTQEQTMHLKGYRLSLGGLYAHLFDEPHRDAHRARGDVLAMLRCCVELRRRGVL